MQHEDVELLSFGIGILLFIAGVVLFVKRSKSKKLFGWAFVAFLFSGLLIAITTPYVVHDYRIDNIRASMNQP